MPELGLELVRDVDRERFRSRLPRWDPRLWGDAQFSKNTRPGNRLLKLGLAWGRERVKARKLQQENVTPRSDEAPVSRFTGKEEDTEVGLIYFGKRFLSPYLGRWVSADPLAVHSPGSADLNLYAYVNGRVLKNTDPLGLAPTAEQAFVMKGMDEVGVAMKNPGLSKQMKELVLKVNVEWMDLGGDTMRTDRKYAWFGMRLGLDRKLVPGRSMFDIGAFAMHEGVHIRDDQVSFGGGDAQYTEGRAYAAQTFLNVRGGGAVSEQNRLWRIAITSGGTGAGAGDGFR
ncbi:MAG TPA: RHS repeat-associated core domain-containing protein, partial [Polyangiaceae bacterium]|nr:RHS repeat-associated core domain-containing protein [Polyangiaceae bacterium]